MVGDFREEALVQHKELPITVFPKPVFWGNATMLG